ncbi:glycosyltransferase family 2 protein [Granulicoccus phenolivorans]|uniref:glycosyltransferase family 2 protein n=1 Tax=Granulicoccus phenolivorans TaxID=266854 RepID=UPI0004008FA0|nr:glycosyltransferase family 2 protein [Granulicoccus phenolivorans]
MADPGLTVIVGFYNLADLAPTTLASIGRAIDARVRVLLIDDGSGDRTPDLLARAARELPGARMIRHDHPLGASAVRNRGVAETETAYLTFLDGDDYVAPGYFGALLDDITAKAVPMLRCDHVVVTGRDRVIRRIPSQLRQGRTGSPRTQILPAAQQTSIDHPYAWAGIYHRELAEAGLLTFDEHLHTAEDRPWIWRLHLAVPQMAIAEPVGLFYRRDLPGSLSRVVDSRQFDFVPAMEQAIALVLADPEADRFLPKVLRRYCELTLRHLSLLSRYPRPLRRSFLGLVGGSLARCPQPALDDVLAELAPERRSRLTRLIAEHTPQESR